MYRYNDNSFLHRTIAITVFVLLIYIALVYSIKLRNNIEIISPQIKFRSERICQGNLISPIQRNCPIREPCCSYDNNNNQYYYYPQSNRCCQREYRNICIQPRPPDDCCVRNRGYSCDPCRPQRKIDSCSFPNPCVDRVPRSCSCIDVCTCTPCDPYEDFICVQNSCRDQLENMLPIFNNYNVEIRHTEGHGIGYTQGYTTLEGQFNKSFNCNKISGFLDLRLHFFNNNTHASNIGMGIRFLTPSKNNVLGVNVYYDYRKLHDSPVFNQIAVGFEWLGRVDCRFKAYIPLKNHEKILGTCSKDYEGGYEITKAKFKKALSSVFFEVGCLIEHSNCIALYGAVSQYFLEVNKCSAAFGGKTRLKLDLFKFIEIEGALSYDTLFRSRAQVTFGLYYTWGGKKCRYKKARLKTPVHNDIIPIGHSYEYTWNW